jgi:hypothetical protein
MQCVDACIALDTSSEPLASPADAGSVAPGASASFVCPEPPFPCERLCWELDARFGRGAPTTQRDVDRTDDTDLRAIGEPLIRCAQQSAAACRAGELPPESAAAASGTLSWTVAFLECAGLPTDLGVLD